MLWFRKSSGYAPSSSSMWLARVDTIEFACGSVPRCCGDPSTAVVIGSCAQVPSERGLPNDSAQPARPIGRTDVCPSRTAYTCRSEQPTRVVPHIRVVPHTRVVANSPHVSYRVHVL